MRVSRFAVTGVTVFSQDQVQALLASGEGRELTLAEIEALASRITALYREHGYILARAYVPAQEMHDGVVQIAVLEGRVGKDRHQRSPPLQRRLRAPLCRAAISPARLRGRPPSSEGSSTLNDLPGLSVKSTLRPGAEPGTTDIVLDADKDRLITGALDSNNYGSPETGYERFGVSLNLNNPSGLGDVLAFRGLTSTIGGALWLARLSYAIPGQYPRHQGRRPPTPTPTSAPTWGPSWAISPCAAMPISAACMLLHPFVRSRELSVYGQAGFDIKNFDNSFQSVPGAQPQHDNLRVFSVGGFLDSVDRWLGASNLSLTLSQGIGNFLGGMDGINDPTASVPGAGGTFTKLTGEVSRSQQITRYTSIFLKVGGQWTSTSLVAPEQYFVGGQGTVRGYPVAQFSGDRGYSLTGEFRWNAPGFADKPAFLGKKWGDILQFYGFVDHGGANLIDAPQGQTKSQTITGAGIGAQIAVPDNFVLKLEYAKPMNHVVGGATPSNGLNNYVYFWRSNGSDRQNCRGTCGFGPGPADVDKLTLAAK